MAAPATLRLTSLHTRWRVVASRSRPWLLWLLLLLLWMAVAVGIWLRSSWWVALQRPGPGLCCPLLLPPLLFPLLLGMGRRALRPCCCRRRYGPWLELHALLSGFIPHSAQVCSRVLMVWLELQSCFQVV
jgi:hypothetical protein